MSKRYNVAEGQEFSYPANTISLQLVKSAGGVSKLTEEERKKVSFKTVTAGQDCSDMPKESLDIYVSRGWVIEAEVSSPVNREPNVEGEEEDN